MTATNPFYIGLDFDAYYNNTAGGGVIGGNQAWLLLPNIRDLKRSSSLKEADVSSRDSAATGPKLGLLEPGLDYRSIEFDIITDETDATYLFLRTQKEARAAVELALANGAIGTAGSVASGGTAGITYLRLVLKIFGWDEDEAMEGGTITHVTLKPCKATQQFRPTRTIVA